MHLFIAILFLSAACLAQSLTVGVKGALRATPGMEGYPSSESKIYLAGPMVEVGLPYHFAFEADALYNRYGYSSTTSGLLGEVDITRVRANSWQFPLLAKYSFAEHGIRPYALLGYAPQHTGGGSTIDSGFNVNFLTGARAPYYFSFHPSYKTDHALVVGGGVQLKAGRLRVTPEVRFLRWQHPLDSYEGSRGYYLLVPQNEVQILVGLGWNLLK
jgi:hypothetical protein